MNIKKHCFYKAFFMGLMAAIFLLGAGDFAQAAGWETVGTAGFSGDSAYPEMVINPVTHEPYVVFVDAANGDKATVMKFDGNSWTNVGPAGFSTDAVNNISLAIDPISGDPYVAYSSTCEGYACSAIFVKKFDGNSWTNVGPEIIDGGIISNHSLAINPTTGKPYILYDTQMEGWGCEKVAKYSGSAWLDVGGCASQTGNSDPGAIGFQPVSNLLYIAYADWAVQKKITVMRYGYSSEWETIGSQGFSDGPQTMDINLAFHPTSRIPYVSYGYYDSTDDFYHWQVQKYGGSSWNDVGPAFDNTIFSLAFDTETDKPLISFWYYLWNEETSTETVGLEVKQFSSGVWSNVDQMIENVTGGSMAFDPSANQVYVAYSDNTNSGKATVVKNTLPPPSNDPLSITGITDGGIYFNRDLPRTIEITGGTGTVHATLDSAPLEGGDDTITTPYSKSYSTDGSHQLIVSDDVDTYTLNFSIATNVTIIDPTPLKVDDESLSQGYLAYEGADSSAATQTTFNINHTFINNNARLLIPHDTTMTKTGGGSVNITDFTTQDITSALRSSGMVLAGGMRIGIVGEQLSFSQPITLSITVSSAYNGQELKVTSKSAGESSWQDETSCTVTGGVCTFTTSHATDFAAGPGPLSVHEPSHINLTLDATLAISCTDQVTMGPITGDGQSDLATNTATCNVRTNNSNGYKLEWLASTPAMISNSNPADTISSYSPISPTTPEPWSINAADSEWGAKLKTGSTTYDAPTWGSQDTYTNGNWLNISSSSPYQFISRPSETLESGDDESILFGAQVGADHIQPSGTYEAQVTITATSL